jgi:hypothetical protein
MSDVWPWIVVAGLGAFHGLNPAMGWLFAVALGLHRNDRSVVWLSLLPIAAGHALSVAVVAAAVVSLGLLVDGRVLGIAAGMALIAWALYCWRYGSHHRVHVGLQTGLLGLGLWSFLMATAHGAGLMLWPALMPLCFPGGAAASASGPVVPALAGIGLHTLAMLLVTGAIAVTVYEWVGLAILRRAWINLDLIWSLALTTAGFWLILGWR